MMRDCKYNTFGEKKLTFFESDFKLKDENKCITYLMGEATNKALLDTGASSTVCGKKWLTVFEESLTSAEHEEVKVTPCEKNFCFGDGDAVTARIQKALPVTICGQKVTLNVFIVENDIPLLLSRESMKKMKMKIDTETDKVYAFGGEENLVITKSGHMMIPIGRCESSISQTDSGRTNHATEIKVRPVLEEKITSPWSLSDDESDQEEELETFSGADNESVQDNEPEIEPDSELEDHGVVSSVSGNVDQDSEPESEPEIETEIEPDDHGTVSSVSGSVNLSDLSVNQSDWESVCQTRTGVGVKKNDIIRFRSSESDDWNNALVIGRAGKPTGKNKNLYNVRLDESNGEPVSVELDNSVQVQRLKIVQDVSRREVQFSASSLKS